jgi:WhiB family redox-sensing transcriptional regulator
MLNDWKAEAACRGMDVNLFFPEPSRNGRTIYSKKVRETCASCPVRQKCYTFAKTNLERGYWGGFGETERRLAAKESRNVGIGPWASNGKRLQPCGTDAAHRRHRKAGETPCQPCIDAYRKIARERKARKTLLQKMG